jgi:flagellar hook assembly protein FlgD
MFYLKSKEHDMPVVQQDIYDKEGNLIRIEVHNEAGEFLIQFLWDERDEQTSENREEFRKWAMRHLRQSGHEVHK